VGGQARISLKIDIVSWLPSMTQSWSAGGAAFSVRYTSPGSSSWAFWVTRQRPSR
jgi:hypothetical protein